MTVRRSLCVLSAALLSACVQNPHPVVSSGTGLGLQADSWVVVDGFPSGIQPSLVGQVVNMRVDMASDLAGRVCRQPTYKSLYDQTMAGLLGGVDRTPTKGLDVMCGDVLMSRYAVASDGALLTRHQDRVYRLEPTEVVAARPRASIRPAMPEAKAEAAAHSPMTLTGGHGDAAKEHDGGGEGGGHDTPVHQDQAHQDQAQQDQAKQSFVYLESYGSKAAALAGWKKMHIKGAEPVTREVNLGAKGTFVRLFAATKGDPKAVCRQLPRHKGTCGVPAWMKM